VSKLTVSIIIVSRNRHQALRRCLESIVSAYSRYAYDELILIDSSDEAEADNNQQLAEALGLPGIRG
jgi:glycosyltransferase involved in cell wall biosynthesis